MRILIVTPRVGSKDGRRIIHVPSAINTRTFPYCLYISCNLISVTLSVQCIIINQRIRKNKNKNAFQLTDK